MINRPFFRDRSRDDAMVTDFWRESAKIGIPNLHSVRWHSTVDGTGERINTADDPPFPLCLIRNVVNFSPVTSEFCRRICAGRARGGLCHAFLIHHHHQSRLFIYIDSL